ncbi:MAG: hypothetical protein LBD04_03090 [Synergistaceae bacterium]|jgi:hypothetical protein|nr:hypothetical protein [Synergistaceae bacterium]
METNIARYREILIVPVRQCAEYNPKFGHKSEEGFSLSEFQSLYSGDSFYHWLGLDNPLMYSAHKVAGGITSVYRQIGIGCERLIREVFKDYLGHSDKDVKWSYTVPAGNGKIRTLSLDGGIILNKVTKADAKGRIDTWRKQVYRHLGIERDVATALNGIVFEIHQGYKSKDSKRQNADIANATNAYTNGYLPYVCPNR